MSQVSNAIKLALTALNSVNGQTLQYRVDSVGPWTALPNSFLLPGPIVQIGWDENHNAIMAPASARLKVPTDGVHLVPGIGGVRGAEVKDQTGVIWAVVGTDHSVGQSIYLLARAPVVSQGAPRGSTP